MVVHEMHFWMEYLFLAKATRLKQLAERIFITEFAGTRRGPSRNGRLPHQIGAEVSRLTGQGKDGVDELQDDSALLPAVLYEWRAAAIPESRRPPPRGHTRHSR